MKIVVLAGGLSPEREVSLVSGAGICRALRRTGHRAILIDSFLGLDETLLRNRETLEALFDAPDGLCPPEDSDHVQTQAPDLDAVRKSRPGESSSRIGAGVLELCQLADLVFLGLHGEDGEDGRLQAMLELYDIAYTGSGYLSSAIAMDKIRTKEILRFHDIPTPDWQVLDHMLSEPDRLAETLPMPCVIKTSGGGSSLGVYLPENRVELRNALQSVRQFHGRVLAEQRISGREFTVPVLGDRWLPAAETIPAVKNFDYIAKYQKGGAQEICPAEIPDTLMQRLGKLALRVHHALGLSVYSRTDMILEQNNQLWVLETNSLPGMTQASFFPRAASAVGISYDQLCEKIARLSLSVRRRGEIS